MESLVGNSVPGVLETGTGSLSGWPGLAGMSRLPQSPMLAQLKDPALGVAKLWNLPTRIERRGRGGAGGRSEMTVLRSHFIMCMHLVTHQETFFSSSKAFFPSPLMDMLKDHT